jgi:hypothetical protein
MKTTALLGLLLPVVGVGLVLLDSRKAAAAVHPGTNPDGTVPVLGPNPTTGTGTGTTAPQGPPARRPWPSSRLPPQPLPANIRTALTIQLNNFAATAAQLDAAVASANGFLINVEDARVLSRLKSRAIAQHEAEAFQRQKQSAPFHSF